MWKVRTVRDTCPLCGRKIIWSCNGEFGYAHCSRSPKATVELVKGNLNFKFCHWEGKCRRRKNGEIEFIYEIDDIENIRK